MLLISSIDKSNSFNSDRFSAFLLFISISILRISLFPTSTEKTYSCLRVWISSLIFCSRVSTSRRTVAAIVRRFVPSFLAFTLNSVRSSERAALNKYAAYYQPLLLIYLVGKEAKAHILRVLFRHHRFPRLVTPSDNHRPHSFH